MWLRDVDGAVSVSLNAPVEKKFWFTQSTDSYRVCSFSYSLSINVVLVAATKKSSMVRVRKIVSSCVWRRKRHGSLCVCVYPFEMRNFASASK